MEGLNKKGPCTVVTQRTFICAAIMAAFGLWLMLTPKLTNEGHSVTEDRMIEMTPVQVMGASFQPGPSDSRVSGKMDEQTYRWLKPFGIVVRQYRVGEDLYDAVLIASRNRQSFHDPRVCFSAQNWVIDKNSESTIETKTRGVVPVTMLQISQGQTKKDIAAYLYKGPGQKFYSGPQGLKWGMLWEQIKGGADFDGVFYRFIPSFQTPASTPEEHANQVKKLKKFIAAFLDAANESSKGYF